MKRAAMARKAFVEKTTVLLVRRTRKQRSSHVLRHGPRYKETCAKLLALLGKQKVYYPRVSAEAEDVRYTIQGFRVLIKNDFEV